MGAAPWLIWEAPQGLRADGLLAALADLLPTARIMAPPFPRGACEGRPSGGRPGSLAAQSSIGGASAAFASDGATPGGREHPWARGAPCRLAELLNRIAAAGWSAALQQRAARLFTRLAAAIAQATGQPAEHLDLSEWLQGETIADLLAVLEAGETLGPVSWSCSGAVLGGDSLRDGSVRGEETARIRTELLRGATLIDVGRSSGPPELGTTVAGAALAAELVDAWQVPAKFVLDRAGYGRSGAGSGVPGALTRAMIGSAVILPDGPQDVAAEPRADFSPISDEIVVLETNLDDVTGEVLGYCLQRLMSAGALDAYATSIYMKKNRPATKLTVLSPADRVEGLENLLFRETGTLGIRRWTAARRKLPRESDWVETIWGPIAGHRVTLPDGSRSFFPEYEDCRRLAEVHTIPLQCVLDAAKAAGGSSGKSTK